MIDLNRLPEAVEADDLLTIALADLAAALPAYDERALEYLDAIKDERPEVIMLQGVRMDQPTVLSSLGNSYNMHVSRSKTRFDYCNVTCVSKTIDVVDSDEIHMSCENVKKDKKGNEVRTQVELAPDCLVDTLLVRGRRVRLYNYEAIRGPFYEAHRVHCANLITKDAYVLRRNDPRYRGSLMYLGGDLHADEDFESVRLLGGKMTRDGVYASAFTDVWPVMHALDGDPGITERSADVLDSTVKIPQYVRPKRHTYFMAYGDVFGRAGSPLQIEINGNHTTDAGIPWSDDYGLTMTIWVPPLNDFTTDDD